MNRAADRGASRRAGRYAQARRMKRMHRQIRRRKTYRGRVRRDVRRPAGGQPELEPAFARLRGGVERLLDQRRHDKNKLHAPHAPEVVCIAKGKADEKYGFGRKVALAATNREGFAVASKAFAGNPYDGHDLRQGRPPWPLCHLPTGRGRSIERPIPENPEPDR